MDRISGKPSRRSTYLDRAKETIARGHAFFPETVFKDIVVAALALLVMIALATFLGAPLEPEANPAGSSKPPRPEWYFLFLFEVLKYLPGELEWIGAVLVPTIALIALFLLPLYDRGSWRHPLNRPLATGLAVVVLAGIAGLTYAAATAPAPPAVGAPGPTTQLTPLELQGKNVYASHSCPVCHQINGVGGNIGPDLSTVGRRLTASWLVAHLQTPSEIAPGTRMPQITLTNDELMALTAYLLSLTQPETRTPAQLGAEIFSVYCNSCHPGGKAGVGPSLVGVSPEAVTQAVREGRAGMPAFGPTVISDEQLAQVQAYLHTVR
ncbi:MAG: c-type cytochrome [Chloroflexota bacterium]|nr:MAG: c-type cytochrome [Chloroflexota bacterium]